MQYLRLILLCCAIAVASIDGAKILAVFPFPGPSQYIAVQALLKTLAARGHELTVITQHPLKQRLPNYNEIILESDQEAYDETIKDVARNSGREQSYENYILFARIIALQVLSNPEVKALMQDRNTRFDLVILETLWAEALYGFGPHFGAHMIGFSSSGTDKIIDQYVGNDSPLSYIPPVTSDLTDRMNFWQRLKNIYISALETIVFHRPLVADQTTIYEEYFPHLRQPFSEVRRNFTLLLINQHFSLSFPRSYVPNMIEVGGCFLNHKPAPLPKDIEDFLNSADENGVIYFSMGSNFKSTFFAQEEIAMFLKVFGKLKQRVLWKFENPQLPGKPDNVLISKWFPQPDILAHPKVKLFITHGGLLGIIEAVHYAKPVLGIPVFYDHFKNIQRAISAGFGVSIAYKDLNENDFVSALNEILSNPKYTKAVQTLSTRYHDQPIKPLDNAVFWTEYILRHNGAEHIRVSARNLSFFEYHNIDVFAFVFCIVILSILSLIYVIRKIYKSVLGEKRLKNEKRD